MIISSIVAISNNNAIGVDNDLPWQMPADLKFFKETTLGHYVMMGRKSFESVGRPLPGRTNIVVTRNKDYNHSGIHVVHSIVEGLRFAMLHKQEELFILGGSNIYFQTLPIWNKLYVTEIDTEIPNATAFFPIIKKNEWNLIKREEHRADDANPHDYAFCLYERPTL